MTEVELKTRAWHGHSVVLEFPDAWDVETYWPDLPAPLSDAELEASMAAPLGQPRLREIAQGKRRPVIIVDDLSRPTPAGRVLPFLLGELASAGIPAAEVRIVIATGTHGAQDPELLRKKLGRQAFESCRIITHRHAGPTKYVGKTAHGTPIHVNREVWDSDLRLGVGGVYPQHTTGFGGGAKLALGVLGMKSIASLHFGHEGVDGSYDVDNTFRHDLEEIARLIQLETMFTLHVDAEQNVVHLMCGDHFGYFERAAEFSRKRYDAPSPKDADVVIANAFPADSSVFFMRKAMTPLDRAPAGATNIMVASNHDGLGHHGLFYPTQNPRLNHYLSRYRRLSVLDKQLVVKKVWGRVRRVALERGRSDEAVAPRAVEQSAGVESAAPASSSSSNSASSSSSSRSAHLWVYAPPGGFTGPSVGADMTMTDSWPRLIDEMKRDRNADRLKVRIYPCSSLQCIAK